MSKTLPSGWHRYAIGQLAQVGNGSTPSRKEPRFWTNGIYPWLPTGKVNDRIITDANEFISQAAIDEWPMKLYPTGSILVAMIGQGKTRGMVAYLAIDAAINQNFACVVPGDDLDSRYLFYFLENSYEELRLSSHGSNQGALNCSLIGQFPVNVPPLAEQRRIAEILGTWDEAIALTGRLIDALRDRKKGLMQLLLIVPVGAHAPQARFPGFTKDWTHQAFGSAFERVSRRNDVNNTTVLTASGLHGLVSQMDFFNKSVAGESLENYYLLKRGEFAYNRSSSAGYPFGAIKRLDYYEAGVLSTLYICFKLADEAQDGEFFKHFFEAGGMNREIYGIASEGARSHGLLNIGISDFFDLNISVPSIEEQQTLAGFFEVVDQELELAEKYLEALQAQKRGLMQQLLTGQIRVGV